MSNRRTFLSALAMAAGTLGVAAVARAQTPPEVVLTNVSYDPTRELYRALNDAFAKEWQAEHRPEGHHPHLARRLGQAGALGDRRARGRRRDAGARRRHRRHRPRVQDACRPTGRRACRNNSSPYTSTIVFLVRKGNPKAHQGLGRPRQARRLGHHAQPEDLGRRALELSRRLGLRARPQSKATRRRRGSSSRRSTRTCRCSTPARAARPPPSPSAASATC